MDEKIYKMLREAFRMRKNLSNFLGFVGSAVVKGIQGYIATWRHLPEIIPDINPLNPFYSRSLGEEARRENLYSEKLSYRKEF